MLLASIPGNMQAWIHFSGKGIPVPRPKSEHATSAVSPGPIFKPSLPFPNLIFSIYPFIDFKNRSVLAKTSQQFVWINANEASSPGAHQTIYLSVKYLQIKSSLIARGPNCLKTILKKSPFTGWFLCGIRDSNPRTPARQDLKSCAFGQLG